MYQVMRGLINFTLFFFATSQMCGPKTPTDSNACLNDSNDKNVCCFARVSIIEKSSNIINRSSDICFLVPRNKTFIAPYLNQIDLGIEKDDIVIKLDCGENTEKDRSYMKCGKDKPEGFMDCKMDSKPNASCCYFKSPGGEATCLLNNGISDSNSTVFGVIIACNEIFIKLKHLVHVFLILIIVLIF
jgi:hypothetical protein